MPTREELQSCMMELILDDNPMDAIVPRATERFPEATSQQIKATYNALVEEMGDQRDVGEYERPSITGYRDSRPTMMSRAGNSPRLAAHR